MFANVQPHKAIHGAYGYPVQLIVRHIGTHHDGILEPVDEPAELKRAVREDGQRDGVVAEALPQYRSIATRSEGQAGDCTQYGLRVVQQEARGSIQEDLRGPARQVPQEDQGQACAENPDGESVHCGGRRAARVVIIIQMHYASPMPTDCHLTRLPLVQRMLPAVV